MRALVRETRLSPDMFMLPLFVCEGEGVRREVVVDARRLQPVGRRGGARKRRPRGPTASGACCCSACPITRTTSGRRPTIPRRRCSRRSAPSSARCPDVLVITDVCLCEYTDHGHCGILDRRRDRQRPDGRSARARRGLARRGRRRHRRAVGHDGRPRRRDPAGARRARLRERGDHVVRGEVLLGVLRPVPRRGRVGADSSATAGRTRWIRPTSTRRCARSSRTSRKAPTSSW